MKIFISFFVLATCLWAKEIAYTDEVVSLYLNKDDTKVTGRLLPTNAFEILKSDRVCYLSLYKTSTQWRKYNCRKNSI